MRKIYIAVIVTTFLIISARAEDLTTVKGQKFKNIEIQRTEPDGIVIKHSSGLGKVFYSELPPEMRTKYGYDPGKLQQFKSAQQQIIAQAGLARLVDAASISASAKISQMVDQGALAYVTLFKTYVVTNVVTDSGRGDSTFTSGITGTRYTLPSGAQGSVVRNEVSSYTEQEKVDEPVFIEGIDPSLVDGDSWEGKMYLIGTYSYTTVNGATKKVRRFTALRERALKFYAP